MTTMKQCNNIKMKQVACESKKRKCRHLDLKTFAQFHVTASLQNSIRRTVITKL